MTTTKLQPKESWDGEHLSELALSCLADGQLDVIDEEVRAHAEACAECMLRIGELALESHAVGAALMQLRAPVKHKFPVAMTAVAAAVAILCALPALMDGLPRALPWVFAAPRLLPLLTTTVVALAHDLSSSPLGRVVSVASAATLCLIGFALARASRAASATKA